MYVADSIYNDDLIKNGDYVWAKADVDAMIKGYRSLVDLKPLRKKRSEISKDKRYDEQAKLMETIRFKESQRIQNYTDFYYQDVDEGDLERLAFWNQELEKLNEEISSSVSPKQKMAVR